MKLGLPGKALEIEVDTNHFKGNFPESFWVEGRSISDKDGQFSVKLLGKILTTKSFIKGQKLRNSFYNLGSSYSFVPGIQ